jgi:hypothetical protein
MQLASAVILTSPFLCWADHPKNYLASGGYEINIDSKKTQEELKGASTFFSSS